MPKLLIRVGIFHDRVYDQGRLIHTGALTVIRGPQQITVRVPFLRPHDPE